MALPDGAVALTGDLRVDYVAQGSAWQLGADRVITYSLDLNYGGPSADWTQPWIDAVARGFAAWEAVADIHFVRSGAINAVVQNASTADMAVSLGPEPGSGIAGIAVFPDSDFGDLVIASSGDTRLTFPRPEGDITYNPAVRPFASLALGSEGFDVILHEIGHALGLKHVDDNGGRGRPVFHGTVDQFPSVMWSASAGDGFTFGGPSINDIAAIQHIYGANLSYRTGDDSYRLGDLARYRTLWDAGGEDAIVAAPTGSIIDLHAGASSFNFGIFQAQLVLALGVTIENARGGDANDTITGNGADNTLLGRDGNDTLAGDAANDRLSGGNGGDALDGGVGADTLLGGSGNDRLDGGTGSDRLNGGDGADAFVFDVAPDAGKADRVGDFQSRVDEIFLDGAVFGTLAPGGTLARGEFRANAGAHALDAGDHILYDTGTGALYYDADGDGAGARVQIALLVGAPDIVRGDFTVT